MKKKRLGNTREKGLPDHCARQRCNNDMICEKYFCPGIKIIINTELRSHDIEPKQYNDGWLDSESNNRNIMLNLK